MTDSPLVSTAWLADHLADVQVVDATWYMPGESHSGHADYLKAHIPGAVFFDIDAISDKTTDLPHMLPTPEAFAHAAGALGLRRDKPVVVYDGQGVFSAPRVWWTLRVMGFPNVSVLDGGLKAWRAEGRPTQAGDVHPTPSALTPSYDAELVRDLAAVRSQKAQILDARAAPRFRGDAPEPRPGLRSGHMPGALNVPWSELVDEDGRLKSPAHLASAFAGMDVTAPITTTCGSGVSAAILALALAQLGQPRIPVYDGSWAEWGGRDDTPVVTGP